MANKLLELQQRLCSFVCQADIDTGEAFRTGRTATDYTGTYSMTELNLADPQLPRNISGVYVDHIANFVALY